MGNCNIKTDFDVDNITGKILLTSNINIELHCIIMYHNLFENSCKYSIINLIKNNHLLTKFEIYTILLNNHIYSYLLFNLAVLCIAFIQSILECTF